MRYGKFLFPFLLRFSITVAVCVPSAAAASGVSASVVRTGGVPRIALNGKPVAGMAVVPNPREDIADALGPLSDFTDAGICFSSVLGDWWLGEGEYDWESFDRLTRTIIGTSENMLVFPRVSMNPPKKWLESHPEETFAGKVDPASKEWRKLYRRMLKDLVRHVEASDYADRVVGYQLAALHCGEWLVYPIDKKLRPPVGEADAVFPSLEATEKRRRFIRGISDAVADAVIDSAAYVRELTGGKKLVGSFMGYFAMSHESAMRVFESGKVDFIAAPPRYHRARETGFGGRSQMYFQGSCRLHGCVFYEETDFRTFLSLPEYAPKNVTRMRPLGESVGILRRSVGKLLAGGWENWWFLLGGNRSYSHPDLAAVIRRGAEVHSETILSAEWKPAEVAVFTSAGEYLTSTMTARIEPCDTLKTDFQEFTLPVCGVPFDSYELADIMHPDLPDYKVYVFPNALTLTEPQRAKLREIASAPGKTAVWFRGPGYYRGDTGSFANVAALTNGTRGVFFANAPGPDVLRETFRDAGVHVWIDTPDVISAGRGFLMVHASSDGEKRVRLPHKADVEEIFGSSPAKRGISEIRESLRKGETRVWRIAATPCKRISFKSMPQTMLYGDTTLGGEARPFAKDPTVIRHDGRYLMYYSVRYAGKDFPGRLDPGRNVDWWGAVAESRDLVNWSRIGSIVLKGGPEFSRACAAPCVKKIDGRIHLFHQAIVAGSGECESIWHATSEDGVNFISDDRPMFTPSNGWSVRRAIDAEVYRAGDRMILLYASRDPSRRKQMLGMACAPLAGGFAPEAWRDLSVKEPLLKPERPWEMNCIEAGSVIERDGIWYMFYAGAFNHERQQIGVAWSADGVRYARFSDGPVFTHGKEGSWNAWESGHPGVFEDDDGQVYLFYQGKSVPDGSYRLSCVKVEFEK